MLFQGFKTAIDARSKKPQGHSVPAVLAHHQMVLQVMSSLTSSSRRRLPSSGQVWGNTGKRGGGNASETVVRYQD
jgi:hypothetical protein